MGNLKLSNFKHYKTTLIGLVFIASGILLGWKHEALNIWIFIVLEVLGLLLVLSPDDVVKVLRDFLLALKAIYTAKAPVENPNDDGNS